MRDVLVKNVFVIPMMEARRSFRGYVCVSDGVIQAAAEGDAGAARLARSQIIRCDRSIVSGLG